MNASIREHPLNVLRVLCADCPGPVGAFVRALRAGGPGHRVTGAEPQSRPRLDALPAAGGSGQ